MAVQSSIPPSSSASHCARAVRTCACTGALCRPALSMLAWHILKGYSYRLASLTAMYDCAGYQAVMQYHITCIHTPEEPNTRPAENLAPAAHIGQAQHVACLACSRDVNTSALQEASTRSHQVLGNLGSHRALLSLSVHNIHDVVIGHELIDAIAAQYHVAILRT